MKRYVIGVFALVVAAAATASPALAALRVPQLVFDSASLQGVLTGLGQVIDVDNEQWDSGVKRWETTPTGPHIVTLQIELSSNPLSNEIGIYNSAVATPPPVYPVFNGSAPAGWFAVASFSGGNLNVALFNSSSVQQSLTQYPGVSGSDFGFYIKNKDIQFGYTEDSRHADKQPRALVFKGTGVEDGNWWVCFEDNLAPAPALVEEYVETQHDFDDAVLLVEALNPTPVSRTSWGALKSRFR